MRNNSDQDLQHFFNTGGASDNGLMAVERSRRARVRGAAGDSLSFGVRLSGDNATVVVRENNHNGFLAGYRALDERARVRDAESVIVAASQEEEEDESAGHDQPNSLWQIAHQ